MMCTPCQGMPEDYAAFVEGLGTFVTWVFIVEMFFKIVGLGCTGYWSDGWNMLDGIIVSLSIVEMLITILLADTGINISFLRMLRLLRLLRLLKAWPGLYKIVMAFVKAIPQISNLFVLMFLLMFIFALLGMQAFGGTGVGVGAGVVPGVAVPGPVAIVVADHQAGLDALAADLELLHEDRADREHPVAVGVDG